MLYFKSDCSKIIFFLITKIKHAYCQLETKLVFYVNSKYVSSGVQVGQTWVCIWARQFVCCMYGLEQASPSSVIHTSSSVGETIPTPRWLMED